jgi:hypothetical protein
MSDELDDVEFEKVIENVNSDSSKYHQQYYQLHKDKIKDQVKSNYQQKIRL